MERTRITSRARSSPGAPQVVDDTSVTTVSATSHLAPATRNACPFSPGIAQRTPGPPRPTRRQSQRDGTVDAAPHVTKHKPQSGPQGRQRIASGASPNPPPPSSSSAGATQPYRRWVFDVHPWHSKALLVKVSSGTWRTGVRREARAIDDGARPASSRATQMQVKHQRIFGILVGD